MKKSPQILPIVKRMGHSDKDIEQNFLGKIKPRVEWLLINIIALFV